VLQETRSHVTKSEEWRLRGGSCSAVPWEQGAVPMACWRFLLGWAGREESEKGCGHAAGRNLGHWIHFF